MQKNHAEGLAKSNPGMLYDMIKTRLLLFHETEADRQARVMTEFDTCMKGSLSALQWEAVFERAVGELESAGLPQNADQLRIKYIQKVGPENASIILTDLRPRMNPDGVLDTRHVKTWQEAHALLVEHEAIKKGQIAILKAYPHAWKGPNDQLFLANPNPRKKK